MPRVKGKVIATEIKPDGGMFIYAQLNGKLPAKGENITVKYGSRRSISQNNLYWKFLTFLIEDGGLKTQGHWSPDALHLDFKAHFLAEKTFDKGFFKVIEEGSTADLTKVEFGEYMEKIDVLVNTFFGCDTSVFWSEYEKYWKK